MYSMKFPQNDYSHLMFYVRLWTPSQIKCLSPSKTLLQVRLELTTSALLCCLLPYKYRTLTDGATGAVDSSAFYQTLWSLRSDLSVYSMNFPQTDYSHLMFYVRLWTPSQMKCLSPSKTLLHVRLELTTSALLCCVLPYKHRALTDCPTGAVDSKAFYQTLWSLGTVIFQLNSWNFL